MEWAVGIEWDSWIGQTSQRGLKLVILTYFN